jgi:hypothetical protein
MYKRWQLVNALSFGVMVRLGVFYHPSTRLRGSAKDIFPHLNKALSGTFSNCATPRKWIVDQFAATCHPELVEGSDI